MSAKTLLALLLGRRGRSLRRLSGLGLYQALLKFINTARRIDKFLMPRVKGMARIANANDNGRASRTRLNHVAASATHL